MITHAYSNNLYTNRSCVTWIFSFHLRKIKTYFNCISGSPFEYVVPIQTEQQDLCFHRRTTIKDPPKFENPQRNSAGTYLWSQGECQVISKHWRAPTSIPLKFSLTWSILTYLRLPIAFLEKNWRSIMETEQPQTMTSSYYLRKVMWSSLTTASTIKADEGYTN